MNQNIRTVNKECTVMIIAVAVLLLITSRPILGQGLSPQLIPLPSETGEKLLRRSNTPGYFLPLTLQFLTQETQTYCSIATSVMVLSALQIPAPVDDAHPPFKMFTQDNFFTSAVQEIIPMDLVKKQGSTLDQIRNALATFAVSTQAVHANEITVGDFRRMAARIVKSKKGYIIVNYLRTSLNQEGSGHMSPLAAYDQVSDRFLILDVARYHYPPVWVRTQDLWNAMRTKDDVSQNYRGFVVVSRQRGSLP